MGFYSEVEIIRREGLPDVERAFVTWAIHQSLNQFVFGTQPRFAVVHDYGPDGGQELEMHEGDMRAALLSPVSFAAVVDDLCRWLKVPVPHEVEQALAGEEMPMRLVAD